MYATNAADLKAEIYAKEQQQRIRQNQTPCDNPETAGCGPCGPDVCGANEPEPLLYRLYREAQSYGEQAAKKARAVKILERHPEFEELIELLRLVPIY